MGSDIGRVYFSLANERSVTHSYVRAIYHLIRIKQTPHHLQHQTYTHITW